MHEAFLQRAKEVKLASAPSETDEADKIAVEYLKNHTDRKEHLLVYNGEFTMQLYIPPVTG